MINELDRDMEWFEFELQSRNCFYFDGKVWNPIFPPEKGLIVLLLLFFNKNGFRIK